MSMLFLFPLPFTGARVSVIGGLESWTGVLDWSTGVLECTENEGY